MVGWICHCRCTTCWPARPIPCPTSCAPSCPRVGNNRPGATSPAGRRVPMVRTLDNTTAPKRLRCALSAPWPWHWACLVAWTSGASMAPPPCLGHHDPPAWADTRRSLSPPPLRGDGWGATAVWGWAGSGGTGRARVAARCRRPAPVRAAGCGRLTAAGASRRVTVPRPPPCRAPAAGPRGGARGSRRERSRPSAPACERGRATCSGSQARVARACPPYCHRAASVSGLVSST